MAGSLQTIHNACGRKQIPVMSLIFSSSMEILSKFQRSTTFDICQQHLNFLSHLQNQLDDRYHGPSQPKLSEFAGRH
jgi:hypothetical protein